LYLIDACQSIGQTELDVNVLHCDFLSVTSRKFLRGPRGAGFLYISDRALDEGLEPLFIDMRGADWVMPDVYVPRADAKRFEDWEFAYSLLLGTAAAIEYLDRLDIHKVEKQIRFLADYLRSGLGQIDGINTYDLGASPGGLVTFHLRGHEPEPLKELFRARQINVVTSYRNFAVIDYDYKKVPWTIRVSPHYFNTIEELDYFLEVTSEIANSKEKR
ncbi:MAG TPA: aminotransferase class V-fold PLP-dependent enzyme, partial [Cyclobacteriaceae bacterium]|nr:aminotransferase class V-fold PLP-dependent enzyme [Cyclobacteriaceae bacterium]